MEALLSAKQKWNCRCFCCTMLYSNKSKTSVFGVLGCAGSSLLHGLFSSCRGEGRSLVGVCRLLIAEASLVAEHRLQGSRASCGLGSCAWHALEHWFSSRGARADLPRGLWDLPRSGSNPRLLHWQVDSLPLSHLGKPCWTYQVFNRRFLIK